MQFLEVVAAVLRGQVLRVGRRQGRASVQAQQTDDFPAQFPLPATEGGGRVGAQGHTPRLCRVQVIEVGLQAEGLGVVLHGAIHSRFNTVIEWAGQSTLKSRRPST